MADGRSGHKDALTERTRGEGKGLKEGKRNGDPRLPPAEDSLPVIMAVSTKGLPRRIPEY